MADSEGKQFKDASGNIFTVKNGKYLDASGKEYVEPSNDEGPSTLADVRDSAATGVAQGTAGLLGTPGSLATLAGRGISKVGEWTGSDTLQNAGQAVEQSRLATNWSPQAWEQSADPLLKALHVDPNYQPQTNVGRYARTLGAFAPATAASMIAGPEAMLPALTRGVGGAVGSETLGHAVEDYTGEGSPEGAVARMVGALGGGMLGPRAVTPVPATSPARTALANQVQGDIKPFGGTVEAAQATGSPTLRALQGDVKDQSKAVTQSLFDKAGIKYDPYSTQKLTDQMEGEYALWKQQARVIDKNTNVVPDNQFWNELRGSNNPDSIAAQANKAFAHNPAAQKEFDDAIAHFNTGGIVSRQVPGSPPIINGPEYTDFLDKYKGTSNKYIKQMIGSLQNAADRSSPLWQQSNEKFANIQGLTHAAEKSGADRLIKPSDVVDGMYKNTPMRDAADSMNKVLAPVKPAEPLGLAGLATTAGGTLAGHFSGFPEGGVVGLLLAQQALRSGNTVTRAMLNNPLSNAYLKNQKLLPIGAKTPTPPGAWGTYNSRLSPQQAALLLAHPSGVLQQALTAPQE